MFGVLISYLSNFNVGHRNGIENANGHWNNALVSTEEHKSNINKVLGTYACGKK